MFQVQNLMTPPVTARVPSDALIVVPDLLGSPGASLRIFKEHFAYYRPMVAA
jgi:hypothetical protein